MKRLQQLLDMLQDNPEDSFLSFAVAKEYEGMGQSEKALDYYLRLTANDPDYVGAYYHLGKLYEKLNRQGEALQTYDLGMEIARKAGDRHALNELAGARLALEDG
jgi:tetratricopeptide (TPR) repeat protein